MPNHDVMDGCVFERIALTQPLFHMLDLGAYPALITGETAIPGELYQVSDDVLRRLDGFEGVPQLYVRTQAVMGDGSLAWIYLLNVQAYDSATLKQRVVVPDGDWAQWVKKS
jgi:gamma-glutamylcyclotransferase (GGCT)/AIG2-like uncharacterized protein YtfP